MAREMTSDASVAPPIGSTTDPPQPSVAVIMPVHDRANHVRTAVDSVLAQTYPLVELIVVDDGSTDGTGDVLRTYGDRIVVLRQEHAGPYTARNTGLRHTDADLVAFLDSDDVWLPHHLAVQVPLFARDEVGLVFANARIAGSDRTTFQITPPRRGRVAPHFAWGNFISTSTVVVRRDVLGAFSERSTLSGDYLAWFRISLEHELDHVDEIGAVYRVHEGGISYRLGPALATRVQLFEHELALTSDPVVRRLLRRILFHLSLHLWAAIVRRKSSDVAIAWRASRVAHLDALRWLPIFVARHGVARAKRAFA